MVRLVLRGSDGVESALDDVPVDTLVTVRHPDTVDVLGPGRGDPLAPVESWTSVVAYGLCGYSTP